MISRVALPNNGQTYRFGFNGKENDNGVKGLGNQVDYGMRVQDPRIGRFLSLDPLQKKFPELTPYQFSSNGPIANVDLDGKEAEYYALKLAKNGAPDLTLIRSDENVGMFGSKLVPKRVVTYKEQTYTFEYKKGSENEWDFYEFVSHPDAYIKKYNLESDETQNTKYWADALLVVTTGATSTYRGAARNNAANQTEAAEASSTNRRTATVHNGNEEAVNPGNNGTSTSASTASNSSTAGTTGGNSSVSNASTSGMNNPNTRNAAALGNQVHYDQLNGSTGITD
jgi:RHS repeat-associated protein